MFRFSQHDATYLSGLQAEEWNSPHNATQQWFFFHESLCRFMRGMCSKALSSACQCRYLSITLCFLRMRSNSEFAGVNRPGGRQIAGIQMERVDAKDSSIELGI